MIAIAGREEMDGIVQILFWGCCGLVIVILALNT